MEAARIESYATTALGWLGKLVVDWVFRFSPAIVALLIFLPLFGVFLESVFRMAGFSVGAHLLKSLYSLNCHQIPSRCPEIFGTPAILCFRCTGFYSGLIIGWILSNLKIIRGIDRIIMPLIIIPVCLNLIDTVAIGIGLWDWPGAVRFTLGVFAGLGPAYLVMNGIKQAVSK